MCNSGGQLGHVILWISLYDFVHFVLYMCCAWPSKVELSVARGVLALDEPTSGQPPNIRAECRSKNGQRCKKKKLLRFLISRTGSFCMRHSCYNCFSISMYFETMSWLMTFHVSSDSGLDSETALSLGHLLAELAAEGTSWVGFAAKESFGLWPSIWLHLAKHLAKHLATIFGFHLASFGHGCPG